MPKYYTIQYKGPGGEIRVRRGTTEDIRRYEAAGTLLKAGPYTEEIIRKWTAPVSAKELKEEPQIPEQLPPADTKGVDTAFTNAISTSDLWTQEMERLQREREALEKSLAERGATGEGIWQKMLSLAGKKPAVERQKELEEQQIKYEVPEWLSKVQAQNIKVAQIQGDITKLDTERQTEIDRAYSRAMPMSYIRGEVNEINRTYNSKRAYKVAELSAQAALMQAYQGNLTAARSLVADAVNAYVYDIQQKRSDFDTIFNIYGDWVNSLEAEDRNLLEQKRADLEREEERVRTEKTNVMNLMLQYPEAGITLEDTVEEATEKASKWQAAQPAEAEYSAAELATARAIIAGTDSLDNYSGSTRMRIQGAIEYLKGEEVVPTEAVTWKEIQDKLIAGTELTENETAIIEKQLSRLDIDMLEPTMRNNIVAGLSNQFTGAPTDEKIRKLIRMLRRFGETRETIKNTILFSDLVNPDRALLILGEMFGYEPLIKKVAPEVAEKREKEKAIEREKAFAESGKTLPYVGYEPFDYDLLWEPIGVLAE